VRVSVARYPGLSPFYLALERGYFKQAGIDIQTVELGNLTETVAMLSSGQVDLAFTILSPALMNAVARGAEVRVVLGRDRITPGCGDGAVLYARKAAFPKGTSDIKEWNGKKLWSGVRLGHSVHLLDELLLRAGLDPKNTPRTLLSQPEAVAALQSGGIDAMFNGTNLPLGIPQDPAIVRETAGAKLLENRQISHVLFGQGILKADVSLGTSVLACYLRGSREFQAGATPQFLKDLVASQGRRSTVLTECRTYSSQDGRIDLDSVRRYVDWAIRGGYGPAGFSAEKLLDTRFQEGAYKESLKGA